MTQSKSRRKQILQATVLFLVSNHKQRKGQLKIIAVSKSFIIIFKKSSFSVSEM